MDYQSFIQTKKEIAISSGFDSDLSLYSFLYDFQQGITKWALRKGKAAIFLDCGLGKTAIQLTWADAVAKYTGGNVLVIAPLAVSKQTNVEGEKFGIAAKYCKSREEVLPGISITNYERLENFDADAFLGVVLDESSILKSFSGKTRNELIEKFKMTPYKLCCTATPCPNDFQEIGNHSEFLDVMKRQDMLSYFFIQDYKKQTGGKWKLKGHAEKHFWEWIASWAIFAKSPADLGYKKEMSLPGLNYKYDVIESEGDGSTLFNLGILEGIQGRIRERRSNFAERVARIKEIIESKPDDIWLIWATLNEESSLIAKECKAIEIKGADSGEKKENTLFDFAQGKIKRLVTKPSIAGFGMNFQKCHSVIFCGLTDSYETMYQAIRRTWRYGQEIDVTCYIVLTDNEQVVLDNIKAKADRQELITAEVIQEVIKMNRKELATGNAEVIETNKDMAKGENFTYVLGDCVEVLRKQADSSLDYSIFSPPFQSLYTYSDKIADMGNCKDDEEFYTHFGFLVAELYRVIKPGRLVSFHCMTLPYMKEKDGFIGLKDFRGQLIAAFEKEGFIFHSEVCIWKDPVTQMQRTKALGLLHKQIKKDSSMCRQGLADYLVTMRKPGDNAEPISHTSDDFPVGLWQNYASPVWMDINSSDTLQKESARDEKDEKHLCPLQLEVIRRALKLWTNPKDVVLSPFGGIASEGYVALEQGRKFFGIELKESYFAQGVKNLQFIEQKKKSENYDLFSDFPENEENNP